MWQPIVLPMHRVKYDRQMPSCRRIVDSLTVHAEKLILTSGTCSSSSLSLAPADRYGILRAASGMARPEYIAGNMSPFCVHWPS
jgi:hypothetical protein